MTVTAVVARQCHRAEAGDQDIWSVQISIISHVNGAIIRGIGDADAATAEQADAKAWADAVASFCEAAWLHDGDDLEFAVMGQTHEPAAKTDELNRVWCRRSAEARGEAA